MDAGEIVIIAVNIGLAFACGWPPTAWFARLREHPDRRRRTCGALFVVCVMEAIAFAASIGTDILSVGLAVVWGWCLASGFRSPEFPRESGTVWCGWQR